MGTALWAVERAAAFWATVGAEAPFPRDLDEPIAVLELLTVDLPRLRVSAVDDFLAQQGIEPGGYGGGPDYALHACLWTGGGRGLVLLDADDPPEERRFSLAHELAHFLRDDWTPRRRVREQIGPRVVQVFDRKRPATIEERIHALLAGVPLTTKLHLMARDADARIVDQATARAEREADELACELLAPEASVLPHAGSGPTAQRRQRLTFVLCQQFGLPARPAAAYAARLVPEPARPSDLLQHLRATLGGRD